MSAGQRSKSGSSRVSKTSRGLSTSTSYTAKSLLWTLKLVVHRLHVLASRPQSDLLLLFQSMTPDQRAEATGLLRQMNANVGGLYNLCWIIEISERSSKTDSMTSRSYGEPMDFEQWLQDMIQCSYTMLSNQKASRD